MQQRTYVKSVAAIRGNKKLSALVALVGLILFGGLSLSLIRFAKVEAPEERSYREENARKVTHGWNQGVKAGMAIGQDRARNAQRSSPSREIAKLATSKREEAGITDEVEAGSFQRGSIFGFYEGFSAPEKEEF